MNLQNDGWQNDLRQVDWSEGVNAEVIAIGDELTSGQRLDTNSQWLSERLGECGVRVLFHTTVADDLAAMTDAFRIAAGRADAVVSSGGLGPTADDLTRDALAAVAGVELVEDAKSLRHIEALFRLRKREMPERNRIQALFPAGSMPIDNPHGTAPGIDMKIGRACRWFALPGVPAEMFEMWRESVGPAIRGLLPEPRIILHRRIKCFGAGESRIEELLPDLIRRGREPLVGITASRATITLRVTAGGRDAAECEEAMQPTLETIREKLGDLVFGEEDEELEHVVACQLRARGARLATVEVGTGGEIAQALARLDSGVVAASWVGDSLAALLPAVAREEFGDFRRWESEPLDDERAAQIAFHARELSGAEHCLVTIAPSAHGARADAEIVVAIAVEAAVSVKRFPFLAHPDLQQTLAAKRGLNELRLSLSRSAAPS
jgi:nicotinamide-nucleotide amidase